MIVFDTYAWIEYFEGSQLGQITEKYLNGNEKQNQEEIITPSIVLIELSCKSSKEEWDFEKYLKFIKSKSTIVGINEEVIIQCGDIYIREKTKKPRFGMVDGVILTIAKKLDSKILTGDEHFRDLDNSIVMK